jgi:glutamate-1-semialdehyde aminotransferase
LPGLEPLGVPRGLEGTSLPFSYNNLPELMGLLEKHKGRVAAVVMEPVRSQTPDPGFLEGVRDLASRHNAVLVFDEISSGFRYAVGGFHLNTNVSPDVAVFAKAMSNGYPMAAILGTDSVMESLNKTFVSSTYWSESIGPVAALATIKKLQSFNVKDQLNDTGLKVREIWERASLNSGVNVQITGLPAMSYMKFQNGDSLNVQTLYTQFMLEYGILAGNRFYANFAHSKRDLKRFEIAVEKTFLKISNILKTGLLRESLKTREAKPGFGRLN